MRLFDDELMTAVFSGDIKATQLLIRVLLNKSDLTVTKSMSQVQKTNLFGKSVKLDIKDEEGNYLPFDDDCNIMYVNGKYAGDDPLGRLMHDFATPNADEMYYDELADRMRFCKQNERGVKMVSKIVEEYGDKRAAEALKQGIQQKAIEDARNLLIEKIPPETIARCIGLPLEKVLELHKSVQVKA